MSSTTLKQKELLQSQTSAEETSKEDSSNKKLITRTPVVGTPFTIIETETEVFITMGKYKMTDNLITIEQCLNYIEKNHWDLIVKVISVVATDTYNLRTGNTNK